MSADCSLGYRGENALKEDRGSNYPNAPLAPKVMNVDRKPSATDDSDNYRVDLLKKFCTNDVNNTGTLSGINLIDSLKEYGKSGTKNRDQILSNMNSQISQINAGDAANQIKYLLCQQADSYIAPPRPTEQPEGSQAGAFWREYYLGGNNWANWIFAILSFGLIALFLMRLYWNIPQKSVFWIYLLATFIFLVLCLVVLFQNRCLPGQNRYYSPDETNPTQITILVILGLILLYSILNIGMGYILKNSYPQVSQWFYIMGFGLLMVLGLSTDVLFALFQPQGFIIAVILFRMITWIWSADHPWSLPAMGIISKIITKAFGITPPSIIPSYVAPLLQLNTPNDLAFGWISKLRNPS